MMSIISFVAFSASIAALYLAMDKAIGVLFTKLKSKREKADPESAPHGTEEHP